jgi:hypothetical protein
MYWRPFIREDDGLTPGGGVVKPRPQQYPSTYHGKLACYEGDPVYCNTCKSWGVTKCVPPYRPHTDPEGRQANLDGDLCLCKCPTPPRLKASFDNVRMGLEEHEVAAMPGAILWRAHAGHEIEEHEIVYEIVDAKTGSPVEGMTYKLASGGRTLLDSKALDNGTTKPYSINEHPNLSFVAWIKGDNK